MPTLAETDAQIQRRIARVLGRTERAILSNYRTALNTTRVELSKLYERFSVKGELTLAEMTKFNRLSNLSKDIAGQLGPVFVENGVFTQAMATVAYEQAYYQYGWAVSQDIGVALEWGLIPTDAVRAAVTHPVGGLTLPQRTRRQRRQALAGINDTIRQGLIQGESAPGMARRVKGFLEKDAARAITIVRTETTRLMAEGQMASFEQAEELGVEMQQSWNAALDAVTRPTHADLDGQVVNVGESFDSAVGPVSAPGHFGIAEQDVNCRCVLVPVVSGMSAENRRIRDEGVVPYTTYREWVKGKPELLKQFDKGLSKAAKDAGIAFTRT